MKLLRIGFLTSMILITVCCSQPPLDDIYDDSVSSAVEGESINGGCSQPVLEAEQGEFVLINSEGTTIGTFEQGDGYGLERMELYFVDKNSNDVVIELVIQLPSEIECKTLKFTIMNEGSSVEAYYFEGEDVWSKYVRPRGEVITPPDIRGPDFPPLYNKESALSGSITISNIPASFDYRENPTIVVKIHSLVFPSGSIILSPAKEVSLGIFPP